MSVQNLLSTQSRAESLRYAAGGTKAAGASFQERLGPDLCQRRRYPGT